MLAKLEREGAEHLIQRATLKVREVHERWDRERLQDLPKQITTQWLSYQLSLLTRASVGTMFLTCATIKDKFQRTPNHVQL